MTFIADVYIYIFEDFSTSCWVQRTFLTLALQGQIKDQEGDFNLDILQTGTEHTKQRSRFLGVSGRNKKNLCLSVECTRHKVATKCTKKIFDNFLKNVSFCVFSD